MNYVRNDRPEPAVPGCERRAPMSKPRRAQRFGAAAVAIGAVAALGLATPTAADHGGLHVRLDPVTTGTEGAVVVLARLTVPAELVGHECLAVYAGENNSSVHPGTDLLVTSADATIELNDVEDTPGAVTSSSETFLLDTVVTVAVRLGPDGISSLGATLDITCTPPPATLPTTATTATTAPVTVTTDSTSTADATTTTTTAVGSGATAPTTTSLVASGGPLPATGTSSSRVLVLVAGSLLLAGAAMSAVRRID